jgi:hypothetical protein
MGYVDKRTIRYVKDPLDGPHEPDDATAVIRLRAMITPRN